jgi:hypothetical protein
MGECWAGTRWFPRSAGSWISGEKKMNIQLDFFVKIDVVTIDIELASFSYVVGRILRRSQRKLMR